MNWFQIARSRHKIRDGALSEDLRFWGLIALAGAVLAAALLGGPVLGIWGFKTMQAAWEPEMAPQGRYVPIVVTQTHSKRYLLVLDRHLVTIKGSAAASALAAEEAKSVSGLATDDSVQYSVECRPPHFWQSCPSLQPGTQYYARWTSPNRSTLAISKSVVGTDGKLYVDLQNARLYNVRSWQDSRASGK